MFPSSKAKAKCKAEALLNKDILSNEYYFTCVQLIGEALSYQAALEIEEQLNSLKYEFAEINQEYLISIEKDNWLTATVQYWNLEKEDKKSLKEERTKWLQFVIDNI